MLDKEDGTLPGGQKNNNEDRFTVPVPKFDRSDIFFIALACSLTLASLTILVKGRGVPCVFKAIYCF